MENISQAKIEPNTPLDPPVDLQKPNEMRGILIQTDSAPMSRRASVQTTSSSGSSASDGSDLASPAIRFAPLPLAGRRRQSYLPSSGTRNVYLGRSISDQLGSAHRLSGGNPLFPTFGTQEDLEQEEQIQPRHLPKDSPTIPKRRGSLSLRRTSTNSSASSESK